MAVRQTVVNTGWAGTSCHGLCCLQAVWRMLQLMKLYGMITYTCAEPNQCEQESPGNSCVSVGSVSLPVMLTCFSLCSARVVAGLGCCNMFPLPSICQPLLGAQDLSPNVMFSL